MFKQERKPNKETGQWLGIEKRQTNKKHRQKKKRGHSGHRDRVQATETGNVHKVNRSDIASHIDNTYCINVSHSVMKYALQYTEPNIKNLNIPMKCM